MSDPVRWRNELAAEDERRALLLSHHTVTPTAKQADDIWSGLQAHLDLAPNPPPVPPGPGAGPAAAVAGALASKVTLSVVLLAMVGAGVELHRIHARDRGQVTRPASAPALPSPPSPVATPAIAPAPSDAERPATLRLADVPRRERTARRRPAPSSAPSVSVPTGATRVPTGDGSEVEALSQPTPSVASAVEAPAVPVSPPSTSPTQPIPVNVLLEESRRLERARAALRSNDPDGALQWLAVGSTRALIQEREALTIEAMNAKPGLRAAAAERAESFLRTYPESPYRGHVKAIAVGRK
jgi:hypothetical protein